RVEGGREIRARLIDISMSGVAISCPVPLPLGAAVTVGSTPGRLVRYFEGGFGVQFLLPLSPDRFHAGMTL
ncbi:PilZ domain-containing protein, partial [Clostridioides difficile]